jgi:TrmH family RNA methyltransferase
VITSVDNPRVKAVLRLRRSGHRRETGLFVAEGRREVERAVAAGLAVRSLYVAPELMPDWAGGPATAAGSATSTSATSTSATSTTAPTVENTATAAATAPTAETAATGANRTPISTATPAVTEVSARVLAHMSYRTEPEGVLGVFEIPMRALPPDPTLVLVAVGIEKPGNLGAMARTADAAGADALLVADAQVDPWNPNAVRASTGAVFTLPIVETTRDELDALPLRKVAATLGVALTHTQVDLREPTAILIGAEANGLPDDWLALADVEVEIPMSGATADSLNASAAAAVLLFEAVRQRTVPG